MGQNIRNIPGCSRILRLDDLVKPLVPTAKLCWPCCVPTPTACISVVAHGEQGTLCSGNISTTMTPTRKAHVKVILSRLGPLHALSPVNVNRRERFPVLSLLLPVLHTNTFVASRFLQRSYGKSPLAEMGILSIFKGMTFRLRDEKICTRPFQAISQVHRGTV